MKIRSGFVSNSSSSSFIVISQNGEDVSYELRKKYEAGITTLVVNGELGHTEFGWEKKNITISVPSWFLLTYRLII